MEKNLLKTYYNDAYQSYLNNISPLIFMNDFLDKIINLTNSQSGYIMSIYEDKYLIIEAINNNIFCVDEFVVQENNMINLDEDMVVTRVVKNDKYVISNTISDEVSKERYSNITNIKTYVCYPIKYLDKVIGVYSLTNAPQYTDDIILKEISYLLGILMNNYSSNISQDKRFISFQLMDEIMNKTNDGIIIINTTGYILYHNMSGLEFIKISINDKYTKSFIEKNINKLIPQIEFIVNKDNKLFKNKIFDIEVENINNEIINYEILLNSVISNNNINHVLLINKKEVNKTNKKNHNLIAFLSHELRNPLQSLCMAVYLLQKKLDNQDNKTNLYIQTISKASGEMKRIINDILDLSKLESNEMELLLDNYNITEIIEELIDNFKETALEKNILLNYVIEPNCPKNIFTDLTRINQILSNLVSNAIKYSNLNEKVLVKVNYNKKNHGIQFTVIDNGIGIPKEEYHNLFKENGKTSNSYKFDVKSNGLGLYLSQKIAHLLDGYISFNSEINKGSIFTLFHPIKLGTSMNNIKNKLETDNIAGKILIVDDDQSNITMFGLLLENFNLEYGFNLDINTVLSGQFAIDICKENVYDLIFMDINMIGIDGCTATKIIKNNYKNLKVNVPVIATTGNILAKKENQNLSGIDNIKYTCFDDIIIKPYDENIILTILNSYLSN